MERTMPVPEGKKYGIFNRTLQLLGEDEVIDKYAMAFEEMTDNFRRGIGLFRLPEEWLPKEGETLGGANWREEYKSHAVYYYF